MSKNKKPTQPSNIPTKNKRTVPGNDELPKGLKPSSASS